MKEVHDFSDMGGQMLDRRPELGLRHWLIVTVPLFVWWRVLVLGLKLLSRESRRTWRRPGIVPREGGIWFTVRNVIESAVLNLH